MVQDGGVAGGDVCWALRGEATKASTATHKTTANRFFIKILLSAVVVVVVPIVLRRLANDRADTRACGTGDQGSCDSSTECCTQHGPCRAADQCSLARANSTLVVSVIVMMFVIPALPIVSPLDSAARALVEVAIVVWRPPWPGPEIPELRIEQERSTAAGKQANRIDCLLGNYMLADLTALSQHFQKLRLLNHRYFQFPCLVELRSCLFSSDHIAGLLADRTGNTSASGLNPRFGVFTRQVAMVPVSTNVRPSSRDDFRFFSAVKVKPASCSLSTNSRFFCSAKNS